MTNSAQFTDAWQLCPLRHAEVNRVSAQAGGEGLSPRVCDRETIDAELRLLVAGRQSLCEQDGDPGMRQVDELARRVC
jgi:hypothetical protein